MGLPSGQQVARLMGVTPLTPAQLWTNHRIKVTDPDRRQRGGSSRIRRGEPEPQGDLRGSGVAGEAPLWFYILKEAEIVGKGRTLGPVGGRIVAEVLVGLLQKDPNSYLYLNAAWKPAPPVAPVAGSSPWPTSSSTRGSGPNKEVMNLRAIANEAMKRRGEVMNMQESIGRSHRAEACPAGLSGPWPWQHY